MKKALYYLFSIWCGAAGFWIIITRFYINWHVQQGIGGNIKALWLPVLVLLIGMAGLGLTAIQHPRK